MSQATKLKYCVVASDAGTWGEDPDDTDAVIPVLRSTEIGLDGSIDAREPAPRSLTPAERARTRLREGDVLVVRSSGSDLHLGKAGYVDVSAEGLSFSNFLQRLRFAPEHSPRFGWYFLNSVHAKQQIRKLSSTTTGLQNLSASLISELEMPAPPLVEQRRIADFLDAETARIDKMRTTMRRLKVVLHERSDAQRSLILRGAETPGPRTLHPMLGDLPASWRVVPLKRLVPRIGVGVVVDPSSYFTEEGVPFLRGSNITEAGIDLTGVRFMSEVDSRTLWRSRLNSGDVVVIRAGYPGRAAVVPDSLDGANCASLLVIKRGKHLLPTYLEAYFNSPLGTAYVNSVRYGAAQEQINVSHVVDFMVPVPTLHEQEVIIRGLELSGNPVQALKEKLSRQEVLLEERRQALITAAVTGQFDVSTASGRNVTEGVGV